MDAITKALKDAMTGAGNLADIRRQTLQQRASFDASELKRLKSMDQSASRAATFTSAGSAGILAHAMTIHDTVAGRSRENRRIFKLAPSISQSAAIHIPSIVSPNDLRSSALHILSKIDGVPDAVNKRLGEILSEEIEEVYHLSSTLPNLIKRAMYLDGAACFVTLPSSVLDTALKKSVGGAAAATEAAQIVSHTTDALKIIEAHKTKLLKAVHATSDDVAAMETAVTQFLSPGISPTKSGQTLSENKDLTSIVADISRLLEFVPTPDLVRCACLEEAAHAAKSKAAMDAYYGQEGVLYSGSVSPTGSPQGILPPDQGNSPSAIFCMNDGESNVGMNVQGEPITIAWPACSLIPITRPSAPTRPVGYLGMCDMDGAPLGESAMAGLANGKPAHGDVVIGSTTLTRDERFARMAQMMNGSSPHGSDGHYSDLMARAIHKETVQTFLKKRLNDNSIRNVTLAERNDIYNYMFNQFMTGQPTRMVFIPADFVSYLAFRYDEDLGTGETVVEGAKDALQGLIMHRVARLMASFTNAVNRRDITLTFRDGFTGNPEAIMEEVVDSVIQRGNPTRSFEPAHIQHDMVRSSVSIKANNIPGLNDFNVELRPGDARANPPDEALAEELRKDVDATQPPPAGATNNLGEAEYSRSVATQNLFYARTVQDDQKVVCAFVRHLTRNHLKYSTRARKRCADALGGATKADGKKNTVINDEAVGVSHDAMTKALPSLETLLDSIEVTLPKPSLPSIGMALEVVQQQTQAYQAIIDVMLPDALYAGASDDSVNTMAFLRAMVLREKVLSIMRETGAEDTLGGFPDFDELISRAQEMSTARVSVESVRTMLASTQDIVGKMRQAYQTPSPDSQDGGYSPDAGGAAPDAGMGDTGGGDMGGDDAASAMSTEPAMGGSANADNGQAATGTGAADTKPAAGGGTTDDKKADAAFDAINKL